METLQQLVVVLPCHTLEDFPAHHDEQNAKSLLANWTALWHPGLISLTGNLLQWVSSDFVSIDFTGSLVLVPTSCSDDIPLEISDAVDAGDAEMVAGKTERDSIFLDTTVTKWLEQGHCSALDEKLVGDFFALGYAFLQVQLMTRQLRYSSSINMELLGEAVVAAARSATDGQTESATDHLQRAFDLIAQERSNYYPTDPSLIDLALVAETTRGLSLIHISEPTRRYAISYAVF